MLNTSPKQICITQTVVHALKCRHQIIIPLFLSQFLFIKSKWIFLLFIWYNWELMVGELEFEIRDYVGLKRWGQLWSFQSVSWRVRMKINKSLNYSLIDSNVYLILNYKKLSCKFQNYILCVVGVHNFYPIWFVMRKSFAIKITLNFKVLNKKSYKKMSNYYVIYLIFLNCWHEEISLWICEFLTWTCVYQELWLINDVGICLNY